MRAKVMIGTLLAAAALAGCGGDDGDSGDGGGGSDAATEQARTDFIAGCVDGGAPRGFCECMYEELSGTHGIDSEEELQKFEEEARAASGDPSQLPKAVRESAQACAEKIQQ